MFIIPLLFIVFIIWIFSTSTNSHFINTNNYPPQQQQLQHTNLIGNSNSKSLEILKDRYAKGEISDEEYFKIKRNLES